MAKPALAVMVPENNTTVAREFPVYFGDAADIEIFRILRPKSLLTAETLPGYVQSARDIAASIRQRQFDAVVYACTAASFINGKRADDELSSEMASLSGLPVVTTAGSMGRRFKDLNCRVIGLVTPYSEVVNASLVQYLKDCAIGVSTIGRIPAPDTDALGRITPEQVEAAARKAMHPELDGIFVACTQLPTLSFIRSIGPELGKPVWSAVRATAWSVAQTIGMDASQI